MSLRTDLRELEDERILTFATPVNGTAEVAFGTTSGRYQHTARANTTFFAEENERGFQYIHSAKLQVDYKRPQQNHHLTWPFGVIN